ncbi:oligosaccharide biosynthesis protein Alg14 [Pontibacter sp. KCTC 32443]|uniref:oligosaccharide biosynthesis protein Alg14 n=1 Tax=Pontibacter TaxID=323449 RepID=UPI00164D2AED|nr:MULTISPECIES: oligosaccharide biosynthesis protein Alg14 [Pontibacter]MBC5773720.1 oligosaccharide biosynthesis protein Alg14 [Pontibacter sp. KCTC 32443]
MTTASGIKSHTDVENLKVMAIASAGGHWIQLLRLMPAFENCSIIFISTNSSFSDTVKGYDFHAVTDANRWNKLRLIKMVYEVYKLVNNIRPNVIISTGAAPGLAGMVIGRFLGAKTIWIDSIANVEKLSLSGSIASVVANRVYTQWPDLRTGKIIFNGNVLS